MTVCIGVNHESLIVETDCRIYIFESKIYIFIKILYYFLKITNYDILVILAPDLCWSQRIILQQQNGIQTMMVYLQFESLLQI